MMFLKQYRLLHEQIVAMIDEAEIAALTKAGAEICGLLVDNGYFIELIKVRNKVKKGGSFAFYFSEIRFLQKALKMIGHEIIGTFHSHPLYIAKPSESDIQNTFDDSYMLIIDVTAKELGFWYIKDDSAIKTEFEVIYDNPRKAEKRARIVKP